MGMFSDICGLFKALNEYLGDLLDPYPKKKGPSIHKPDDKPAQWGADSYEPWDFLSKEQWEEIFRGDKSLEDFTMSHVWPPEKREEYEADKGEQENANAEGVEQENEQEQSEDSENTESSEGSEVSNESEQDTDSDGIDSTSESDSGVFESDASDSCFDSDGSFESSFDSDSDGSGSSGSYDGYIG